ncbi:helix-turn-helix domain-containing protein [Streptomyces sp. NPDC001795]|uniref:helix-turn-helix domain-containing protein n=1 Tax=unclassified Streptomyces TaxID=2593676 RepID=UPI0033214971
MRTPLTPWEQQRGERFGALLRRARGDRSMVEVAAAAGVSAETLPKIEAGRAPTPGGCGGCKPVAVVAAEGRTSVMRDLRSVTVEGGRHAMSGGRLR